MSEVSLAYHNRCILDFETVPLRSIIYLYIPHLQNAYKRCLFCLLFFFFLLSYFGLCIFLLYLCFMDWCILKLYLNFLTPVFGRVTPTVIAFSHNHHHHGCRSEKVYMLILFEALFKIRTQDKTRTVSCGREAFPVSGLQTLFCEARPLTAAHQNRS